MPIAAVNTAAAMQTGCWPPTAGAPPTIRHSDIRMIKRRVDVPAMLAALRRTPPLSIVLFVTCTLLICLIWSIAAIRSSNRHALAEAAGLRQAQALSRAYAEQLRRGVGELDQITLTLKYYWEHSRSNVMLEDQAKHGLYP